MDEAESWMPLHQRRIQCMKAKKASNEKNDEWIERLRTLVEVAKLENNTADELGIHVFTEGVAKEKPSLKQLTNSVKSIKSSQWYTQNNPKDLAKQQQQHTSSAENVMRRECWG